jgi:hypothetical protein
VASVDPTAAVLEFLLAQSAITALTSTRIWADLDQPPKGYTPSQGVGVCFKVRGGNDGDPSVILDPSFQFKIYAATRPLCRQAARVLHDNFDAKANKDILAVRRETLPVTLTEPTTEPEAEWTYALVFYKVMVRSLN